MQQMARNAAAEEEGWLSLSKIRYFLHDRDTKFCASFREMLAAGGVKCLRLPARSPNLNAYCDRWVRTVKEECLPKLILFGEGSLRRTAPPIVTYPTPPTPPQTTNNSRSFL